ncbi:MAG: pyridoxamine 5'-phosphate oxidase family protein [Candidatus Thorarchaeota archaeon]
MKGIRRKEKEITEKEEMLAILESSKYITVAMCSDNEPYLVTLSHGYDRKKNCIYFHCAQEGKKIDILESNNVVWGQAMLDKGYAYGKCDHLYATVQFKGRVEFVKEFAEKKHALEVMVRGLEKDPELVISEQFKDKSIERVNIGRIDIDYISGKKASEVVISL